MPVIVACYTDGTRWSRTVVGSAPAPLWYLRDIGGFVSSLGRKNNSLAQRISFGGYFPN